MKLNTHLHLVLRLIIRMAKLTVMSVDVSKLSPYDFVACMGTNLPLHLKFRINNILSVAPEIAL